MDLENLTPFAARLLRYQPGEDAPVQSTLVVKGTFEPKGPGRWGPADEQMPIVDDPLETPFGLFHGDSYARKDGVDVCVLGTVRPARAQRAVQLSITVGRHSSELMVFGDRFWEKSGGRLAPSSPLPFAEMPLAYTHAYGGKTEHDYEVSIWPDNPVGRGFYLSPEGAVDQPLPNIEIGRGTQIREWGDQVEVAGWGPYPCYWGMRAREGVEPPPKLESGDVGRIKARLNNNAHSRLIVPAVAPDAEIRILGMQAQELVFAVPPFSPVAEVHVGDRVEEARGTLDGIYLWTDSGRVTVTQRIHFNYAYNKREPRWAKLVDAGPAKGR